ncbi:MAG: hypothetical protein JXR95_13880, partial [Deltaproteobacteria bacterium]|nr:hypothetical protein [Deltaproteobacteria bacterium]
ECPQGTELSRGRCVKKVVCKNGMKRVGNQCICPPATRKQGNRCVPVVTMRSPATRCKNGKVNKNNRCVCPSGTVEKSGRCIKVGTSRTPKRPKNPRKDPRNMGVRHQGGR